MTHRSTTAGQWHQRFQRFDNARLTVQDFCQTEVVTTATFYYWRR